MSCLECGRYANILDRVAPAAKGYICSLCLMRGAKAAIPPLESPKFVSQPIEKTTVLGGANRGRRLFDGVRRKRGRPSVLDTLKGRLAARRAV